MADDQIGLATIRRNEETPPPGVKTMTVNELIAEANAAMERMGANNPHRFTMFKLAAALNALAEQFSLVLEEIEKAKQELLAEKEANREQGKVVIAAPIEITT